MAKLVSKSALEALGVYHERVRVVEHADLVVRECQNGDVQLSRQLPSTMQCLIGSKNGARHAGCTTACNAQAREVFACGQASMHRIVKAFIALSDFAPAFGW